jgi:protein-disulfide isomerase
MSSKFAAAFAAILLAGCGGSGDGNGQAAAGGAAPAQLTQIKAPNGDWTQVVTETPQGGMLMGNPDAPVKLVEFASMTCSHCADFAETGFAPLTDKYVKSGQVSLELRNYVRDPIDLAASLLARCNGPSAYFAMTEQMFAEQKSWFDKMNALPEADKQRLQSLPQTAVPAALAQAIGLDQFVQARGVSPEKASACLADPAAVQKLIAITNSGNAEYQIPGTPAFLINNKLVEGAGSWETLEPKINEALR